MVGGCFQMESSTYQFVGIHWSWIKKIWNPELKLSECDVPFSLLSFQWILNLWLFDGSKLSIRVDKLREADPMCTIQAGSREGVEGGEGRYSVGDFHTFKVKSMKCLQVGFRRNWPHSHGNTHQCSITEETTARSSDSSCFVFVWTSSPRAYYSLSWACSQRKRKLYSGHSRKLERVRCRDARRSTE